MEEQTAPRTAAERARMYREYAAKLLSRAQDPGDGESAIILETAQQYERLARRLERTAGESGR